MKKTTMFFAVMMMAAVAMAQQKVAILETVDKAENVSYGVKLLLRSSLTSAISNTPGYEGYDRVDMASITGEQAFQRTGNVSDNQIKQIGKAAGAAYVLVAEAARYDATSIIITAKLLDVETFGVKSSAVLVSGISADEMQESCSALASQLLKAPQSVAPKQQVVAEAPVAKPVEPVVTQAPKVNVAPAGGFMTRKKGDLYLNGSKVEDYEAQRLLGDENYGTYASAKKQFKAGRTMVTIGWIGLGVGALLYVMAEDDIMLQLGFSIASLASIDLGVGYTLRGIGKGRLNWLASSYNNGSLTSENLSVSVAPSVFRAPSAMGGQFAFGGSVQLRF